MVDPIETFRQLLIADADAAVSKSWLIGADRTKRIQAAKSVLQKYEVSTFQFVKDVLDASQLQVVETENVVSNVLAVVFMSIVMLGGIVCTLVRNSVVAWKLLKDFLKRVFG